MELVIIGPSYKETFSIAWLELNTTAGNFVIQPEHAPTVLVLEDNKDITYRLSSGKQESTTIAKGIVEITPDRATIIVQA